ACSAFSFTKRIRRNFDGSEFTKQTCTLTEAKKSIQSLGEGTISYLKDELCENGNKVRSQHRKPSCQKAPKKRIKLELRQGRIIMMIQCRIRIIMPKHTSNPNQP
ncbi:hypothetical protein Tcan_00532, partial [Toxocara canis]